MQEPLTYLCPFCDHDVRVGDACPGCAGKKKRAPSPDACPGCAGKKKRAPSPAKKSWRQDKTYDGLDLPDDDFDYEEFVAREFGGKPHRQLGVKWYWWLLGVALLCLMTLGVFLLC